MNAIQKGLIAHGALVLFIGMLAGLGLLISLLGGLELIPGTITEFPVFGSTDAWVRAHLGGMLNGILIIVIALALVPLEFTPAGARKLSWMLIGTGWANTLFYWAALFAPNRALSFADNRHGAANLASYIGLVPALVFTVVSIVAVWLVVRRAFAARAAA